MPTWPLLSRPFLSWAIINRGTDCTGIGFELLAMPAVDDDAPYSVKQMGFWFANHFKSPSLNVGGWTHRGLLDKSGFTKQSTRRPPPPPGTCLHYHHAEGYLFKFLPLVDFHWILQVRTSALSAT